MIVKDPGASVNKASEIVNRLMSIIDEEIKNFSAFIGNDEPAEHIYLVSHIIGHLNAKILMILEGYASIYAIERMDRNFIKRTIKKISEEYIFYTNRHINRNREDN